MRLQTLNLFFFFIEFGDFVQLHNDTVMRISYIGSYSSSLAFLMPFESHQGLVDCKAFKTLPVSVDTGFQNTNNELQPKNIIRMWLNQVALENQSEHYQYLVSGNYWAFSSNSFLNWVSLLLTNVLSFLKCQLLSRVRLFVTPWTVVCQAPLSMEFARQEDWSGFCN